MVSLQLLSKVLGTKDYSIIEDNMLTRDYFVGYQNEFDFIENHYNTYHTVCDKETFISEFPSFTLLEVTETDEYLVDKIREEYLFNQSAVVIQNYAKMLKVNSNDANEYMASMMSVLQPNYNLGGVNIVADAQSRYDHYKERKANQKNWFFESGFKELDDITHGIQRTEELMVIVARTNQGKSWVLEKMCAHVWKTGYNVGYISPEMTADSIGFRFDTLISNFSNKALTWGKDGVSDDDYNSYIDDLTTKDTKFIVSTPSDFNHYISVSKLKQWIKMNKLDLVAIDGITYLSDERGKKNDNKTTSLTNISEDLMALSVEMSVPILVVVQANRSGVVGQDQEGTPELESIRDSDGIAHNASKIISIQQKKNQVLEIGIKKQRFGAVGGKLNYTWNIDTGEFLYIPTYDNDVAPQRPKEKSENPTHSDVF